MFMNYLVLDEIKKDEWYYDLGRRRDNQIIINSYTFIEERRGYYYFCDSASFAHKKAMKKIGQEYSPLLMGFKPQKYYRKLRFLTLVTKSGLIEAIQGFLDDEKEENEEEKMGHSAL